MGEGVGRGREVCRSRHVACLGAHLAFLRVRTEDGGLLASWQGGRNPFWFFL